MQSELHHRNFPDPVHTQQTSFMLHLFGSEELQLLHWCQLVNCHTEILLLWIKVYFTWSMTHKLSAIYKKISSPRCCKQMEERLNVLNSLNFLVTADIADCCWWIQQYKYHFKNRTVVKEKLSSLNYCPTKSGFLTTPVFLTGEHIKISVTPCNSCFVIMTEALQFWSRTSWDAELTFRKTSKIYCGMNHDEIIYKNEGEISVKTL